MNLKPCPFCGGEVTMQYTGSSDWEVDCKTCPVETKFWVSAQKHGYGKGEADEAERRWNTRSSEAVERDAVLEEAAKMFDGYAWGPYENPANTIRRMKRGSDKVQPFSVEDGYGNGWECTKGKPEGQCGLEVVRPGKVQCDKCDSRSGDEEKG